MSYKRVLRSWLPPVFVREIQHLLRLSIRYSGPYPDWSSASAVATGYDAEVILDRVKQATRKVKSGEAVFERDSVLFDEVVHSFPVLAGLLRAGVENDNRLSVLDLGGSLGSSYYQCRDFLAVLGALQWSVVEQEHFVRAGQQEFSSERLRFYFSISECARAAAPNAALLSGVLQFLQQPLATLKELRANGVRYVVIDRTPFFADSQDRIVVQHVPASLYPASYPCRIFASDRFLADVSADFDVLAKFDGSDGIATIGRREFRYAGMILRARDAQ